MLLSFVGITRNEPTPPTFHFPRPLSHGKRCQQICGQIEGGSASSNSDLCSELGAFSAAAAVGLAGVGHGFREVKHDLASVRQIIEDYRTESAQYFKSFTKGMEQVQGGIQAVKVCDSAWQHEIHMSHALWKWYSPPLSGCGSAGRYRGSTAGQLR